MSDSPKTCAAARSKSGQPAPAAKKRPSKKLLLGGVLGLGVGLVAAGIAVQSLSHHEEPSVQLGRALALLEKTENLGALQRARDIAKSLAATDYLDPDFGGGVDFVLGTVAFRTAELRDESGRERLYAEAATHLKLAEHKGLMTDLKPEWNDAYGVSLSRLGAAEQARLLLHQAVEVLNQVSEEASKNQSTEVFRSQTLMSKGKFDVALQNLEQVVKTAGLDYSYARQAHYLRGLCAEKLGDTRTAIVHYEQTAQLFANTHEGVAASLRAADLLRRSERKEEALEAYRRVLRTIRDPAEFRNRWLSVDDFRERIVEAWTAWVDAGLFEEALTLTESMTPLLLPEQVYDLAARTNERWAEALQSQWNAAKPSDQAALANQVWERWAKSDAAYAVLAEAVPSTPEYTDALWKNARHYQNGHDSGHALEQLDMFIAAQPKTRLPEAHLQPGIVLMDLDRLDEALAEFTKVVERHPNDPASFTARFLIGRCYFERSHSNPALMAKTEQAWRDLINAKDLEPSANEWRQALLSLGRLLYDRAALLEQPARESSTADDQNAASQASDELFRISDDAINQLDEFLRRNPNSPERFDVRFTLAKSLQQRAERPKLRLASAVTDNVRSELRAEMNSLLDLAIQQFRILRIDLAEELVRLLVFRTLTSSATLES